MLSPKSYKKLLLLGLVLSLLSFSQSGYLLAKAYLAQYLLDSAWQKAQVAYKANKVQAETYLNELNPVNFHIKPWPWADIYPVAKLTFPRLNTQHIVLNNDSGQALAFGPGLSGASNISDTEALNLAPTQIISAHRDTHFSLLQHLVLGDEIRLTQINGDSKKFSITRIMIIDTRISPLFFSDNNDAEQPLMEAGLVLITCYPFNSLTSATPFRFIVEAS